MTRLPGFCSFRLPQRSEIPAGRTVLSEHFEEYNVANAQSIAHYFRARQLWDENKTTLLGGANQDLFALREPALLR